MFPNFNIFNTLCDFILLYGHDIWLHQQHHFVKKMICNIKAAFNRVALPCHNIIVVNSLTLSLSLLLFCFPWLVCFISVMKYNGFSFQFLKIFLIFYFNWHIFASFYFLLFFLILFFIQNSLFYCVLHN